MLKFVALVPGACIKRVGQDYIYIEVKYVIL